MKSSRLRATLVGVTTLVLALALSGCAFGGSSNGGTDGGGGSGGSSQGNGTSPDGAGTSPEPGLDDYVGMPDTFPTDLPVIDGDVVFGVDLGTGWSIIVKCNDIVACYTSASSKLTGAGFSSDVSTTSDDGSFGSFSSAVYTVQVTATDSTDFGPSVQYVVIKNG